MDAGRRFDVPHDAAQGIKRPRLRQLLRALLCLPLLGLTLLASRPEDKFRAQTRLASPFALPLKHGETRGLPPSLRHFIRVKLSLGLLTEAFAECLCGLAGRPRLPSLKTVKQTECWFGQTGSIHHGGLTRYSVHHVQREMAGRWYHRSLWGSWLVL